METSRKRNRFLYILAIPAIIGLGLLSRSHLVPLPVFVSRYAGDTLWALVLFLGICVCLPRRKTWEISVAALLLSFAVEFSQFYHAPWIDSLRQTKLGGLVLGFGFKASDLVCYSTGILLGILTDLLIRKRTGNAVG